MRKGVVLGLGLGLGLGLRVGFGFGFGFGFGIGFGFGLGRLGLELTWWAAAPLLPFAVAHSHSRDSEHYPAAG